MNRLLVQVAAVSVILVAASAAAFDGRPADVTPRPPMDAGHLELAIRKLRILGSVLFIAAHPDDENQALFVWLSRGRGARVGYLAMTRGDGGQNLIGQETGVALGALRTQELLSARRIDGAEQFFTRAIDFGYSKTTDETLGIWGHEETLRDVVWVIRNFRPDVIVTRFTPKLGGHGHHTASATLAEEAFEAAADPARFPDQLRYVKPWRTKRLMWNVFSWRRMERDTTRPALTVELGTYEPLLGRSYAEISARGRSMHKTQGFGSSAHRGTVTNQLELEMGDPPTSNLFDGVDTSWSRIPGGARVDRLLAEAEKRFDPAHPEAALPSLLRADEALDGLGDDPWVGVKRHELRDVIRSCAGLWIEAIAERPTVVPGDTLTVKAMVVSRSGFPIGLESVTFPHRVSSEGNNGGKAVPGPAGKGTLAPNQPWTAEARVLVPADVPLTSPYWLEKPPLAGRFQVAPEHVGPPQAPPPLQVRVVLTVSGRQLVFDVPVLYRWTNAVKGERYRPLEIVPPATLAFDAPVYVFGDTAARTVRVMVRATREAVSGTLHLNLPGGWRSDPTEARVTAAAESLTTITFRVSPPTGDPGASQAAAMGAAFTMGGATYTRGIQHIEYDHIPTTTLLLPAEARIVHADLRLAGTNIGYVMGPGDQIPECLRQAGYRVTLLSDDALETQDLSTFDAIVTGVRAYETRPELMRLRDRLLDYARAGGTLVVQYNRTRSDLGDGPGPWPFTISRDRVTEEHAEVRFVKPDHPLLNRPNRITEADFDGWVQERGLNFANPWDERYQTVLACHDKGEKPLEGGLLYAPVGGGAFIYTAYAWFRQLPAGVPGAYRLFANLLDGGR